MTSKYLGSRKQNCVITQLKIAHNLYSVGFKEAPSIVFKIAVILTLAYFLSFLFVFWLPKNLKIGEIFCVDQTFHLKRQ